MSESVVGDAGLFSLWAGRPRTAIEQREGIRDLALPEYRLMVTRCLLHTYAAVGNRARALGAARTVMEAAGASDADRSAVLTAPDSSEALRAYFRWAIHPDHLRFTQGGESSYRRAIGAASAGDVEGALAALEAAFAEREPRLIEIGVEPRLNPIRDTSRFKAIMAAVGVEPGTGAPAMQSASQTRPPLS